MGKGGPATTMPLLVRHAGAVCLQQLGSQRLCVHWPCGSELNLADDVWCTRAHCLASHAAGSRRLVCVGTVGGLAPAPETNPAHLGCKQASNQARPPVGSVQAFRALPSREAVMGCTIWIGSCCSCILGGWEIRQFVVASSGHIAAVVVVIVL